MAKNTITSGSTTFGTPSAGDDIFVASGSQTIDQLADKSGLTDLLAVEVVRGFNGSVGTVTSPFKSQLTTYYRYDASGGDAYFASEDDLGAAVTDQLIMPAGCGGHFHFQEIGTITDAHVNGGRLTINPAVAVTNLIVGGPCEVRFLDDSSTDPTTVRNTGGLVYLERGATTLVHGSGRTVLQGQALNGYTTVSVHAPGLQLIYSGTISQLNLWGGIPDTSSLSEDVTITDCDINMGLSGADQFLNHPLITFTNAVTKYGEL